MQRPVSGAEAGSSRKQPVRSSIESRFRPPVRKRSRTAKDPLPGAWDQEVDPPTTERIWQVWPDNRWTEPQVTALCGTRRTPWAHCQGWGRGFVDALAGGGGSALDHLTHRHERGPAFPSDSRFGRDSGRERRLKRKSWVPRSSDEVDDGPLTDAGGHAGALEQVGRGRRGQQPQAGGGGVGPVDGAE